MDIVVSRDFKGFFLEPSPTLYLALGPYKFEIWQIQRGFSMHRRLGARTECEEHVRKAGGEGDFCTSFDSCFLIILRVFLFPYIRDLQLIYLDIRIWIPMSK